MNNYNNKIIYFEYIKFKITSMASTSETGHAKT